MDPAPAEPVANDVKIDLPATVYLTEGTACKTRYYNLYMDTRPSHMSNELTPDDPKVGKNHCLAWHTEIAVDHHDTLLANPVDDASEPPNEDKPAPKGDLKKEHSGKTAPMNDGIYFIHDGGYFTHIKISSCLSP